MSDAAIWVILMTLALAVMAAWLLTSEVSGE